MVAYDALGKSAESLEDAGSVLTMEPKNPHALQVVAKKRKSLTKNANDNVRRVAPTQLLCAFLFTEDRPLHAYACLRSLRKHLKGAKIDVYVFWQASERACIHSYQLLQTLPETSKLPNGSVSWIDVSNGQLFPAFSRTVNRLSVEGKQHVLLLSDTALFHTDVDVSVACRVLSERREAFTVRLDLNPRIDYFPEASLLASAPSLKCFAGDEQVLLWTRSYDKSKQAYESVPREVGWDSILDWTATVVRAEHMQHFFSALIPPMNTCKELDDKAADWLSRRQRMKQSEISHRSACYQTPLLVTMDPGTFGDAAAADRALRWHLLTSHGVDGSSGPDAPSKLATQVGWKLQECMAYFKGVEASSPPEACLDGLLEPEAYRPHYLTSARVAPAPPKCALPKQLSAPAPVVSWLVPVRNAEFFIVDCFRSIEAQTGIGAGCYEVVFVEDSSDDSTLSILRRLADEHPHVQLVENEGQRGVAASICEGWRHCHGDFVARLDADDEAEPERLVKQLRYMEQHPSISVLGGRVRTFWTEQRKCTIDRISEKADGRVVVSAWREFYGNQTSRMREQFTLRKQGPHVMVEDSSAEYAGCRVVGVGGHSLAMDLENWKSALRDVECGLGEVLLERRDALEPPVGSRALHPLAVRAALLFEDAVAGTTAMLRRGHFPGEACPFAREETEGHWAWLGLEPDRHVANMADPLVRARRHEGSRTQRQATGIYESSCAAILHALKKTYRIQADMHDAAALLNFRGPRTPEQGEKLLEALLKVSNSLFSQYVRPGAGEHGGDFWQDFVRGREAAIERGVLALRARFKVLHEEAGRVITNGDSPRQHRSRTPPR